MVCLSKNENMGRIKEPKELDFLPKKQGLQKLKK